MTDETRTPVQLSARHLTRHFTVRTPGRLKNAKRVVRAVDDVSLDLVAGKVVAVVGESGSGKSVLARMLARIVTPTSGDLVLQGTPIAIKSKRTLDYASQVQLVLQDPFASMNPVHRMSHNLLRPLLIHGASEERRAGTRRSGPAPCLARAAEPFSRELPARTLGRTVATRLDRPGALYRTQGVARRRTDLHAGRLGTAGSTQPFARPVRQRPAGDPATSPTTSPRRATSPTRSSSCTPARWSNSHAAQRWWTSPRTRTPSCSSPRYPTRPTRPGTRRLPASTPRSPWPKRAAGSVRVVRTLWTAVVSKSRPSSSSARTIPRSVGSTPTTRPQSEWRYRRAGGGGDRDDMTHFD